MLKIDRIDCLLIGNKKASGNFVTFAVQKCWYKDFFDISENFVENARASLSRSVYVCPFNSNKSTSECRYLSFLLQF